MVWGILETPKGAHVPGTVVLADRSELPPEYAHIPPDQLRHGTGHFSNVVLSPQPTSSPNDPLNWPVWKKDLVLLITGLSAGVVGAYGPMLSPGFVVIAADLGIDTNTLSQATAWVVLVIGLSLFVFNPMAKKMGRRPVYIACSIIMFSASLWGGLSTGYNSFLGSRIWGAFGMAPYEVLVQCTIADLYFVHQRATRIAVWNMFLLCGIAGGALIAGYIIENQGWHWTFLWCAILFGALLPLVFLFVPETAYVRLPLAQRFPVPPQPGEREKTELADAAATSEVEKTSATGGPVPIDPESASAAAATAPTEAKHSFWRSLRVFTGIYSTTAPLRIFLRPFVIFFYPGVFWGFLLYGATLTWIVVFSVVNAGIFTEAPYNFSVSQTGLISLSPFVFTLLGEAISGPLNDRITVWLARKNGGIYEPEFRLPLVVMPLVIGAVGFYGFGITIHYQTHWSGPVLCFGLANMAVACLNASVFPYILDAHNELSEEAFVAINARNFLTFGLTYFVNNWLRHSGALNVFLVLGSIYVAVILTTIPLWVFGKRARFYIAHNQFLQTFMHED
ncbi:cycloheximide resistance protein [Sporothrix brasiliensis 5110]|uniref:Cycloheximide resistance protein n=1 Tax=Sporothrix brasiliensis 5110 TaxID=1398154 RepID=A0A0C2IJK5_9PEZI|nr:cycloheximide resistance protein [Sporothrix brasiliensis 5110]KIH89346.1 cycloheximide resistance protein [Sporothrix brasiliensis 5110]